MSIDATHTPQVVGGVGDATSEVAERASGDGVRAVASQRAAVSPS
jgi:hypothetical protein